MRLLWATRGREWGFLFLRNDTSGDPLPIYEWAYAGTGDEPGVWAVDASTVAVRLHDPDARRDRSGRLILHEVVIFGRDAGRVATIADFLRVVWPTIHGEYAAVWDSLVPPR